MIQNDVLAKFKEIFGDEGDIRVYFAPGRVNLIGEHTDYNGGHVFPCALTIGTYMAARKRTDRKLCFYSMNFNELGVIESSLDAFGLEYLQTIAFILVIAALVQMVEIILKKVSPALYQALGVFLPLITTNCCILGVAILVIQKDFDLLTGVVYAFSTALGFALAMVLFAGIREQLSLVNIPKGMQGMAIALVTAGLLAMAFMGFSGVDKGLAVLFGVE